MTEGKTNLPIHISLPQDFLCEETRCGYVVSRRIKKIWAIELDLLSELDRVAKKYSLRYQVCYGTMLGAVRHKGFIPWDDDMDVWLPREDYDKLCSVAPTEFNYPYFLQTAISDKRYFNAFARLRNSKTTAVIKGLSSPDYNSGIFIDVYPLDHAAPSRIKNAIQVEFQRFASRGAYLHGQDKRQEGSWRKRLSYYLRPAVRMLGYETWVKMYEKAIRLFNGEGTDFAPLFSLAPHERGQRLSEIEVSDSIYVPYEFIEVPIPSNYDKLLSRYYGDYMEFPPEEMRGKYHEESIFFDPDVGYKQYFEQKGV